MPVDRANVLGIAGSLRQGSFNRGLLDAALELSPPTLAIEIADLAAVPLYNADVEARGLPEAVASLKARLASADGLLIATPEYNHLLSGVLKNAIDWVSRPVGGRPLRHKPVAIMGASGGMSGTARAQLSLRQVLTSVECYVLPGPQLLVPNAGERFDSQGRLTDDGTRQQLRALLSALADWVDRFRPR